MSEGGDGGVVVMVAITVVIAMVVLGVVVVVVNGNGNGGNGSSGDARLDNYFLLTRKFPIVLKLVLTTTPNLHAHKAIEFERLSATYNRRFRGLCAQGHRLMGHLESA